MHESKGVAWEWWLSFFFSSSSSTCGSSSSSSSRSSTPGVVAEVEEAIQPVVAEAEETAKLAAGLGGRQRKWGWQG